MNKSLPSQCSCSCSSSCSPSAHENIPCSMCFAGLSEWRLPESFTHLSRRCSFHWSLWGYPQSSLLLASFKSQCRRFQDEDMDNRNAGQRKTNVGRDVSSPLVTSIPERG